MLKLPPRGSRRVPSFVSDEVPLYYQLGSVLRAKIGSNEYLPGQRLPTEAELVKEYGVSRITVRQALVRLEKEGLIRREAGRGTFVGEVRRFTGTQKMEGSLDDVISLGMATEVQLLGVETLKATAEEASVLGLETGALITRGTRLRLYHKEPYSFIQNDFPHEIGKRIRKSDWNGIILNILPQKLGIPVKDASQTVRAAMADARLARLLHTRIGAPLLSVDRIVRTDGGQPIERTRSYYRSDIYSFTVHLTWSGERSRGRLGWTLEKRRR
jgi:GntR family transcriptional regulator